MEPQTLLGRGPIFPLQRVGSDFQQAEGLDLVDESIRTILMTQKGELPWFQEFGSNLGLFRHRPMSTTLLAEAENDVRESITQFEPRVNVQNVEVALLEHPKQGFSIKVSWSLRSRPGDRSTVLTNDRDTEVEI
jgi:hypothetical protein